jgi:hypothetical protein
MATTSHKPAVRKASARASRKRISTPPPPEQPMEIHKPKPIHNWRELMTEIGVIVIGILIALGLEQAVESWHTSEQTELARRAVDTEVRFNLAKANREQDMRACMGRQLAALSDAIGTNDQREVRRLLTTGGFVGPFPWTHAAWQAAVDSGAADRFEPGRRRRYWLLYGTVNASDRAQDQYWDAYNQLRSIAQSGLSQSAQASGTELAQLARMMAAEEQKLSATALLRTNAKRLFGFETTPAEMAAMPADQGELERCRSAAAALGTAR